MSVMGMALKKPAALTCATVNCPEEEVFGENERTSCFPTSYPQKLTANMGVTPVKGAETPA